MANQGINRREFLMMAGGAALALPLVAIHGGCGGGGGSTPASAPGDFTVTSTVVNSHSHTITVNTADLAAGVNKTYTTSTDGAIPHSHTLTITAADFNDINQIGSDTIGTNQDATLHTHDFLVKKP